MAENFEKPNLDEVPEDVAENWIDQLTIRQFNEELKDIFPYIYRLVAEATKAKELGPDDLDEEREDDAPKPKHATVDAAKARAKKRSQKFKQDARIAIDQEDDEEDPLTLMGSKYEEDIESAFEQSMGQFGEIERPTIPVTEYILSMYDRETGAFPKGETAVLTGVEKDYGQRFIEPSK